MIFIDKTGRQAFPSQFRLACSFSEGLAAVMSDDKWGFIDKTGQMVIPPQFDFVGSFSEGLAVARINNIGTGFIDKSGKYVIPPIFSEADDFSEGLAAVKVNDTWLFIGKMDKRENVISLKDILSNNPLLKVDADIMLLFAANKLDLDEAQSFHEGLAAVMIDGKWGFMDKTGKIVIDPQFVNTWFFNEGLVRVYAKDKNGYINRQGQWVWQTSNNVTKK